MSAPCSIVGCSTGEGGINHQGQPMSVGDPQRQEVEHLHTRLRSANESGHGDGVRERLRIARVNEGRRCRAAATSHSTSGGCRQMLRLATMWPPCPIKVTTPRKNAAWPLAGTPHRRHLERSQTLLEHRDGRVRQPQSPGLIEQTRCMVTVIEDIRRREVQRTARAPVVGSGCWPGGGSGCRNAELGLIMDRLDWFWLAQTWW